MAKIRIPFYKAWQFNSLNEIVQGWDADEDKWEWALPDIVQYNIRYRDILRYHGLEFLIDSMVKEAPGLGKMDKAIGSLRRWWKERMHEHIAGYDIQCYEVGERFTVLGHTFEGFGDVKSHSELNGKRYFDGSLWSYRPAYCVGSYSDVHVGDVYKKYPSFDSHDFGDSRSYDNYIFRSDPITEADLEAVIDIKTGGNYCKVHEDIPVECLPILYRNGDNPHFLLATAKPDPARRESPLRRLSNLNKPPLP